MKNITPIQIWHKGEVKSASLLDARIINDDLKSSCSFYYQLQEAGTPISGSDYIPSGTTLAEGNCYMGGEAYTAWSGSNDAAYTFVAQEINVTIVD